MFVICPNHDLILLQVSFLGQTRCCLPVGTTHMPSIASCHFKFMAHHVTYGCFGLMQVDASCTTQDFTHVLVIDVVVERGI